MGAKDKEAKERAVDERIRLKKEHKDKLKSIVKFIRTLDDSVNAITVSETSWLKKFPDLEKKVNAMYEEFPAALIAKHSQVGQALSLEQSRTRAEAVVKE